MLVQLPRQIAMRVVTVAASVQSVSVLLACVARRLTQQVFLLLQSEHQLGTVMAVRWKSLILGKPVPYGHRCLFDASA